MQELAKEVKKVNEKGLEDACKEIVEGGRVDLDAKNWWKGQDREL